VPIPAEQKALEDEINQKLTSLQGEVFYKVHQLETYAKRIYESIVFGRVTGQNSHL
jgi:hypothetical protein